MYRNWRLSVTLASKDLTVFGFGAGLAQGISGAGGMVVAAVALSRTGPLAQQRANTIGGITVIAVCNFPAFLFLGLFTYEVVIMSIIMMPMYLTATWIGSRHFKRRGDYHYRNAALIVLAVAALIALSFSIKTLNCSSTSVADIFL